MKADIINIKFFHKIKYYLNGHLRSLFCSKFQILLDIFFHLTSNFIETFHERYYYETLTYTLWITFVLVFLLGLIVNVCRVTLII